MYLSLNRLLTSRLVPSIALSIGLLTAFPAHAENYIAGQALPQNNSYAAKNESSTPPVSYGTFVPNFYGFYDVSATADAGAIIVYMRRTRQPDRRNTYAEMRFDDLVFTCEDGRTSVTYQTTLALMATTAFSA